MNKSISIIVPVYNAAKTLEHTVGSILSDNFEGNCELILVDDGSTDESPSLCDRLSLLSPDIKVIHKPNGGVSDARNAGIEAAAGEFLMFVDSDDLLPKMALQRCRAARRRICRGQRCRLLCTTAQTHAGETT